MVGTGKSRAVAVESVREGKKKPVAVVNEKFKSVGAETVVVVEAKHAVQAPRKKLQATVQAVTQKVPDARHRSKSVG